MSLKIYILINTMIFFGLGGLFYLVIKFGATKETTWVDTILIPFGLTAFLLTILNVMILRNVKKESEKAEKGSESV